MKKCTTLVLLLGVFVGFGLEQARAQTQIEIGPRIGFDLAGNIEELFLGADARFTIPNFPVLLDTSLDYYFADNFDVWQLSLNALYEFGVDNQNFTPYAGLGLGIARVAVDIDQGIGDNSNTDLGFNLIGGAAFGQRNLKPFVQAQITFGDVEIFSLAGGILFKVSG